MKQSPEMMLAIVGLSVFVSCGSLLVSLHVGWPINTLLVVAGLGGLWLGVRETVLMYKRYPGPKRTRGKRHRAG